MLKQFIVGSKLENFKQISKQDQYRLVGEAGAPEHDAVKVESVVVLEHKRKGLVVGRFQSSCRAKPLFLTCPKPRRFVCAVAP